MNRILKIVGGPLKGAEIALVAGTKVKVGSGDDCDVLVSDPTLEKFAFELDVAEDEVTITTPDGAAKTMLDFEAKEFGSSAFAVGPAEGKWQEIVWAEKKSEELRVKSEEMPSGEVPPKAEPLKGKAEDARPETEDGTGGEKKPSRVSRLVSLVVAGAAVVLLLLALFWYLRCYRNCGERRCDAVASRVTLSDVAARYGLAVTETNGQFVIRGDLKCRADRLAATAAAYQAQPGVGVDLSDDESLQEAAEALIGMVAADSLKVVGATNRVVVLKGKVDSVEELRWVLGAFDRDVPCVAKIDCGQVICGAAPAPKEIFTVGEDKSVAAGVTQSVAAGVPQTVEVQPVIGQFPTKSAKLAKGGRKAVSQLPLCGILTVPYPCIILKSGERVSEGGVFGGYVVEKIRADALTLRDGERTFEWKP